MIKRLDQGLERKLTLISAPAGFGKTTLIAYGCMVCEIESGLRNALPGRPWKRTIMTRTVFSLILWQPAILDG